MYIIGVGLDQSLTSEHAFADLFHYITAIAFTHQHNATATPSHATCPSQSVDEVNGRVRHIVQNHLADCNCVNAARA
jgi:hypothetical protein